MSQEPYSISLELMVEFVKWPERPSTHQILFFRPEWAINPTIYILPSSNHKNVTGTLQCLFWIDGRICQIDRKVEHTSNLMSTRENAKWKVTLLGGLHATNSSDAGDTIKRFRSAKCASLFAYVVFKKPFRLDGKELRAQIAREIWQEDDLPIDVATHRVHGELSWLRTVFGRDVFPPNCKEIVPDSEEHDSQKEGRLVAVAFSTDAGYWINTQVPEARQSRDVILLRDTLEYYHGPFAPSLTEDWAENIRYDLEMAFIEILFKFSEQLWNSNDIDQRNECLNLLESSKSKFQQGTEFHQIFLEKYLLYHQQNDSITAKIRAKSVVKSIKSTGYQLSDNLHDLILALGVVTET